jgi:hypothetical protein
MVTGVRRIVLWFMSTLTVVTLLFGYHTSTSPESATGATGVLASPADGASGTPPGSGTDGAASASSETVTGPSADARWGRCRSR